MKEKGCGSRPCLACGARGPGVTRLLIPMPRRVFRRVTTAGHRMIHVVNAGKSGDAGPAMHSDIDDLSAELS
jgi:hypothetical protein